MDSKHQFTIFCLCVAVGVIGGVLYEIFSLFRDLFNCSKGKNKCVGIVIDSLFGVCFAGLSITAAFWWRFPVFRVYMWIGYALGGIIYLKTLHRMVAFFKKVCYNMFNRLVKRAKKARKNSQKEVDIKI